MIDEPAQPVDGSFERVEDVSQPLDRGQGGGDPFGVGRDQLCTAVDAPGTAVYPLGMTVDPRRMPIDPLGTFGDPLGVL